MKDEKLDIINLPRNELEDLFLIMRDANIASAEREKNLLQMVMESSQMKSSPIEPVENVTVIGTKQYQFGPFVYGRIDALLNGTKMVKRILSIYIGKKLIITLDATRK